MMAISEQAKMEAIAVVVAAVCWTMIRRFGAPAQGEAAREERPFSRNACTQLRTGNAKMQPTTTNACARSSSRTGYTQLTVCTPARAPDMTCWTIPHLGVAYIYTRCSVAINVAHFRMIRRLAVPKRRTEHAEDEMISYAYEYKSQCNRDRPPYQIVIRHHARGLAGSCTCPFYATSAAAATSEWVGRTWCKHIAAVTLLLVDPVTQVGLEQ